jgi:hypothetical protein
MHKFKYYKTLPDKIVQILQDDNMHKYFKYYNTVAQTCTIKAFLRCSDWNDDHVTRWRWCRSGSGKVRCFSAFLVGVSWIVALRAYLHPRFSFSLIHVVPNPLLPASTYTLTHGWIWIWYVQHAVFGVLSESSKMQITLNSVVPSV